MLLDLKARIGSSPEVDDTYLKGWLNRALHAFCSEGEFHWLEKKATANTIASQERYALPSDFKIMSELQVDGSAGSPEPYQLTTHERRVLNSPGAKNFSIFADEIYLYPIPTASGSNNIEMWYLRKPTSMTDDADAPSDSDIANMPEEYHEALVIYAFANYNAYDEEHEEKRELMGDMRADAPGTYAYFVKKAIEDDEKFKRGQRSRMMSRQEASGFAFPNQSGNTTTVLFRRR